MSKSTLDERLRNYKDNQTLLTMLWNQHEDRIKGKTMEQDMSTKEELKDLLDIYNESESNMKKAEAYELKCLHRNMRDYLLAVDEREKITEKMEKLKYKMGFAAKKEGSQEDENEDEEDAG